MAYNSIKPGMAWLDTEGKPIQVHGFSVFHNDARCKLRKLSETALRASVGSASERPAKFDFTTTGGDNVREFSIKLTLDDPDGMRQQELDDELAKDLDEIVDSHIQPL